jgi:hypothetical protein
MRRTTLLRFELPSSMTDREGAGETLTEYIKIVFPGPGIIGSRARLPPTTRHSEGDKTRCGDCVTIKTRDKPIARLARKPGNLATLGLRT